MRPQTTLMKFSVQVVLRTYISIKFTICIKNEENLTDSQQIFN